MAFRGHYECSKQSCNLNFPDIVHLLAEYDPFMKTLLREPKGPIKYVTSLFQSETGSTVKEYLTKNNAFSSFNND
jgi:hypothetical protein